MSEYTKGAWYWTKVSETEHCNSWTPSQWMGGDWSTNIEHGYQGFPLIVGPRIATPDAQIIINEQNRQACREIVEWWDTGILKDGVVRDRAAQSEHFPNQPNQAEREIIENVIRAVAAAPIPGESE